MRNLCYIFMIVLFSRCDYLDLVPEDDIETIETIFEKKAQADEWLKTCYSFITGPAVSCWENVAITGADEFVGGDYPRGRNFSGFKIADGLQMSQEPYGNLWKKDGLYAAIRYSNIFIDNIDNVNNMTPFEKREWAAEIKALKAYCYFELVRRYGPIILVPQNIPVNDPIRIMQQPRSHVDTCFNAIVKLLNEAIEDLPPFAQKDFSRRVYFCKEAALALKARTLLYAASPLFNGNEFYANLKNKLGKPLFSDEYVPEKWKLAALAAEEAIAFCESEGKGLYQGTNTQSSKILNTMKDVENSVLSPNYQNVEALFLVRTRQLYSDDYYTYTLPLFKSTDTEVYNPYLQGYIAPSIKMVEMYYTEHGLPIEADKDWNYAGRYQMGKEVNPQYNNVVALNENVLNLHLRREPRFYASIAADRCIWHSGTNNLLVLPYRKERFGTSLDIISNSSPQNLTGYWLKKMSSSAFSMKRYHTEVAAVGDSPFPVIRMAELYLIKAEAWNEYEGPKVDRAHVYEPLNKIRERAGIPDVETAWKLYSKTPDKVESKEGMREIIHREVNIEFAFEGHRFWNLRRWKVAHEELNQKQYGWNILGETARAFYNNYEGPVVVWSNSKFTSPRDYLFPLRSEEVLVSSCVQNPGW